MATSSHGIVILNSVSKFHRTFRNKSYVFSDKPLNPAINEIARRCFVVKSDSEGSLLAFKSGYPYIDTLGDVKKKRGKKHADCPGISPTSNVNCLPCSHNNNVISSQRNWYQNPFRVHRNSDGQLDYKRSRSSSYLETPAVKNVVNSDGRSFIPILKSTSCEVLRVIGTQEHNTKHAAIPNRSTSLNVNENGSSKIEIKSSLGSKLESFKLFRLPKEASLKPFPSESNTKVISVKTIRPAESKCKSDKMNQRNGLISTTLYSALEMKRGHSLTGLLSVMNKIKLPYRLQTRKFTQGGFRNEAEGEMKKDDGLQTISPQSPSDKWFKSNAPTFEQFKRFSKNKKNAFLIKTDVEFTPKETKLFKDKMTINIPTRFLNPLISTVACSKLIIQEMRRLAKTNKSAFMTKKIDGKRKDKKIEMSSEKSVSPMKEQDATKAIPNKEKIKTQYTPLNNKIQNSSVQNLSKSKSLYKDVLNSDKTSTKSPKPVKKINIMNVKAHLTIPKETNEQKFFVSTSIPNRSNKVLPLKLNVNQKLTSTKTNVGKPTQNINSNTIPEKDDELKNLFTQRKPIIHSFMPEEESKQGINFLQLTSNRDKQNNGLFNDILQRKTKNENEKFNKPAKQKKQAQQSSKKFYKPSLKHDKESYNNSLYNQPQSKVNITLKQYSTGIKKSVNPFAHNTIKMGSITLNKTSSQDNVMPNRYYWSNQGSSNNTSDNIKDANNFRLYAFKHKTDPVNNEIYGNEPQFKQNQELKSFSTSQIYKQTYEKPNVQIKQKQTQIKPKINVLNNWPKINATIIEKKDNTVHTSSTRVNEQKKNSKWDMSIEYKKMRQQSNSTTNILPEIKLDPEKYHNYFISKSQKAKYFNENNSSPKNEPQSFNTEIKQKKYEVRQNEMKREQPGSHKVFVKQNTSNTFIFPPTEYSPPVHMETKQDKQGMVKSKNETKRTFKLPEVYRQFLNSAHKRLAKKKSNINITVDVRREYKVDTEKDSYLGYFTKEYNATDLSKGKGYDYEYVNNNNNYKTVKKTVSRTNALESSITKQSKLDNQEDNVIKHFSQKRHMFLKPQNNKSRILNSKSAQATDISNQPYSKEIHDRTRHSNTQSTMENYRMDKSSFGEGNLGKESSSSYVINNHSIDVNLPKTVSHWYDEISSYNDMGVSPAYKSVFVEHARTYFNKG